MRRPWALIVLGLLLGGVSLALLGWRTRTNAARLELERVRYHELSGASVTEPRLPPDKSGIDLLLEVAVRRPDSSQQALLALFDEANQQVGPVQPLELVRGELEAVVALRGLSPHFARRGLVLSGTARDLDSWSQRLRASDEHERSFDVAVELAERLTLREARFDVRVPGARTRYDSNLLTSAEEHWAHGEYAEGLAALESLGGTFPQAEVTRAHVIAAECAFGIGRTALARSYAEAGLAVSSGQPVMEARLRRVQILALAEGSERTEPPAELERLRATEAQRTDPLERVLDAALDLRLGLLHDRFAHSASRALPAAHRLLEVASQVEPRERLAPVVGALCRAAERVASAASTASSDGTPPLREFEQLAERSRSVAHVASCAIATGDFYRKQENFRGAESAYVRALDALGNRFLPREQREAWYSLATLAHRRGDSVVAFSHAERAARWVSELLSVETDMQAREQLLVNTAGYYAAAIRFAALADDAAAAIAVAEASKGQALAALLQGAAGAGRHTLFPLSFAPPAPLAPGVAAGATRSLAHALGPNDAALSFNLLGMNDQRQRQLAIGIVTRETFRVVLVEQPDGFLTDVLALARAVEQNQEEDAKRIGQRLYVTLVEPIASELTGKDRLFVSPHLRLHTLPWPALHDGSRFLVERFAISRALPLALFSPHPADDAPLFDRVARPRWAIALNPSHAGLEGLPGFEPLFDQLPARFTGAPLRGEQATAPRLSAELQRSNALLFAGHAKYDAAEPLASALFTASREPHHSTNLWPADRIEARHLFRLERPPALVILLGCETARLWAGTSSYGDEAIGLSRAFLMAGARRVVGTLWPVLDRDAEDMLRALAGIERKQDPIRHVQAAQKCLLERRCASRGISSWASFLVDSR